MAQTVSNLTDVLKDAWTQDRLAKQFYDDNPVLERMSSLEADRLAPDTDRDQAAACVILQSFLNHRRSTGAS